MFDIGFTELILVAVIGLLILGPEQLPITVRKVGFWVVKIKRIAANAQRDIEEELRLDEIRNQVDTNRKIIDDQMQELCQETALMEAPTVPLEQAKQKVSKTNAPITANVADAQRQNHPTTVQTNCTVKTAALQNDDLSATDHP